MYMCHYVLHLFNSISEFKPKMVDLLFTSNLCLLGSRVFLQIQAIARGSKNDDGARAS